MLHRNGNESRLLDKDRHLALLAQRVHVDKRPLAGDLQCTILVAQNVLMVPAIEVGRLVLGAIGDEPALDMNTALVIVRHPNVGDR